MEITWKEGHKHCFIDINNSLRTTLTHWDELFAVFGDNLIIELTPENWKLLTGLDGEADYDDDFILINNVLYLKHPVDLAHAIKVIACFEPASEYDEISSQGRGWNTHVTHNGIVGSNGAYIIKTENLQYYEKVIIKPYAQLFYDHPDIKLDVYEQIMKALGDYYYGTEM